MNKNVADTKKRLTIIFIIIVSLVIIVLGISFLSLKYFKETNVEKRIINEIWARVELWNANIKNISKSLDAIWKGLKRREMWKRFERWDDKQHKDLEHLGPINFIELKKDEVVSYNIKEDVEKDFIEDLFEEGNYSKAFELDWFLVRKIKTSEGETIIFKSLRYNFSGYLSDIVIFILTTVIFSSILYFVWHRFVNKAFVPVEENMKDMKNFVHNAWHELKTPLTVIDSNIQCIKDIKQYNEPMLDEIKHETKKLNSLIDSLIQLTDISELKKSEEEVNLKELVNDILHNFKEEQEKKNIEIKTRIAKSVSITTNKDYFYMLLSNLIWNAIKYNKKDWKVNITYKDNKLTIKDTWIWMTTEEIEKIFDRFYKASVSRETEGFGIGLSLVKKIADIYNWEIEVNSIKGSGSSFVVKF